VAQSSGSAGIFDSEMSRLVLGRGGDTMALGGSTIFLWGCIPFVLAILTGRGVERGTTGGD